MCRDEIRLIFMFFCTGVTIAAPLKQSKVSVHVCGGGCRSAQLRKMASPFVPVPVPMDRALSGGSNKLRRPQRASSLGSVSSSLEDSGRGCGGLGSQRQSRCMDRGNRSRTPPPLQSPAARARVNGTLETSVEYSSCPRSISDPAGEERPITPTVLGYEVMEERAKFTVCPARGPVSHYRVAGNTLADETDMHT